MLNYALSIKIHSLALHWTLYCKDCTFHTCGVCSRCRYQHYPLQTSIPTPPASSPALPLWVLLIEADCSPHCCLPGSGCSLNVLWHPRYRSCFHSLIHSELCQPASEIGLVGVEGVVSQPYKVTRETGFAITQHCQSYWIFRMCQLAWIALATLSAHSQKRVSW